MRATPALARPAGPAVALHPSWLPDLGDDLRQTLANGNEPSEYYLLVWGAPDDAPVETTRAPDAIDASEIFLPDIRASAPYPLWVDGEPPRPLGPEMRLAIDRRGGRYLVGEVEWGGVELTQGLLWRAFTEAEVQAFLSEWARMEQPA